MGSLGGARLIKSLVRKNKLPDFIFEDAKQELEMKAHSIMQLCLADEFCRR